MIGGRVAYREGARDALVLAAVLLQPLRKQPPPNSQPKMPI